MLISIAIMAMIALATAGVSWAVATGWQASDSMQAAQATSRQTSQQLYNMLQTARYVGLAASDGQSVTIKTTQSGSGGSGTGGSGGGGLLTNLVGGVLSLLGGGSSGSGSGGSGGTTTTCTITSSPTTGAACLFWGGDDVNPGVIDLCEIVLIEHDLAAKTLNIYQLPASAANASVQFHPTDMDETSDVASFKALPNVKSNVLAHNVASVQFNGYASNGSTVAKMLEFTITFDDGTKKSIEYGNVSLKSSINSTGGL
jgi:hypothetical protein